MRSAQIGEHAAQGEQLRAIGFGYQMAAAAVQADDEILKSIESRSSASRRSSSSRTLEIGLGGLCPPARWRPVGGFRLRSLQGFQDFHRFSGPLQRAVYRREQLAAEMTVADAVVGRQAGLDQRSRHDLAIDHPGRSTTRPKPTIATCGG